MRVTTAFSIILAATILFSAADSKAAEFGWVISSSSTDPNIATAPSVGTLRFVHLWYMCNTTSGIAAAEFELTGTLPVFAVQTKNGFLNAESDPNRFFLAVGACPQGPVLAASIVVGDFAPGSICLGPSSRSGVNATYDCSPASTMHANSWVGFSTGGASSCESVGGLCQGATSVEQSSWGNIKGLYR